MTQELPDWLNEDFISTCLQDGDENKKIVVKTFEVSSVVPPGNNYGSCILRVEVKYMQDRTEDVNVVSLIVKAPVINGPIAEYFEEIKSVEPLFYNEFLPLCQQVSLNDIFTPKHLTSPIPGVIVMEDLTSQGYIMCDRMKSLDFEHCQLYIIASATFHALSVAVHSKNPKLVELLGEEKLYSDEIATTASLKNLIISGIRYFADKVELMDGYNKFATCLRSSTTAVWNMVVDLHKPCSTLNVLTQGDPWTANMMFKYDPSGKVTDIKLLDFQMLSYTSPVHDLIFFIWTSANHEVRDHKLEDLYHLYCDTLNHKLQEFNCSERLSYNQLLEHLDSLHPVILYLSTSFYPIMLSAKSFDPAIMDKECNEETRTQLLTEYYNKEYCKYDLPRIVKQLDSAGTFKYVELNLSH